MEKARLISMVVRSQLLGRGLSRREFARQLGCNADVLTNVISGCETSRRLRFRIEDKLGTAIWSSAEEFAARQRMCVAFGSDPYLLSHGKLRALVLSHGIPGAEATNRKSSLLALLQAHFGVKKQSTKSLKERRQ